MEVFGAVSTSHFLTTSNPITGDESLGLTVDWVLPVHLPQTSSGVFIANTHVEIIVFDKFSHITSVNDTNTRVFGVAIFIPKPTERAKYAPLGWSE